MQYPDCERCGQTGVVIVDQVWVWCPLCQHGTSNNNYLAAFRQYQTPEYAKHNGAFERLVLEWTTNVDLLLKHTTEGKRSVLDVGFLEGSGMAAMGNAGFDCWGFDVSDAARRTAIANGIHPDRLRVAEDLAEAQYGRKFDAITCREVIEHVPDPGRLLIEMFNRLMLGGVAQIQTPRYHEFIRYWECPQHLRVYSFGSLVTEAEAAGFSYVDSMLWPGGMNVTFRREQ